MRGVSHRIISVGSGEMWVVRLICCGMDYGSETYATWEEADRFRQQFVESSDGHERQGILSVIRLAETQ